MRYEELHPGVFIGDCFVVLPGREPKQTYDGTNLDKVQETDWSLRLRLAAPAVPKGAWACLPDHAFAEPDSRLGEIALALRELKAETIQECDLLEVRCSLPGITILQDEYDDLNDLIRDGRRLRRTGRYNSCGSTRRRTRSAVSCRSRRRTTADTPRCSSRISMPCRTLAAHGCRCTKGCSTSSRSAIGMYGTNAITIPISTA